jgi:hypothetical protein
MHRRRRDALAGVPTERVIDNQSNVAGRRHVVDDEITEHEANGIRRPPASREKPMVAADMLQTHRPGGSHDLGDRVPAQIRSSAHPAMSVPKLSTEGAVKHGANVCSIQAKIDTTASRSCPRVFL